MFPHRSRFLLRFGRRLLEFFYIYFFHFHQSFHHRFRDRGLRISSGNTVGTICHETPNLSFSQPHFRSFRRLTTWTSTYRLPFDWDNSRAMKRRGKGEVMRALSIHRHEILPRESENAMQKRFVLLITSDECDAGVLENR